MCQAVFADQSRGHRRVHKMKPEARGDDSPRSLPGLGLAAQPLTGLELNPLYVDAGKAADRSDRPLGASSILDA